MSKSVYMIVALIAMLFGTVVNYSLVGSSSSGSRSYGGTSGSSSSSGWHK